MTLVLLVVLLVALGLVERRPYLWPLVTWPVYDDVRPELPESTRTKLEVRAGTRDGRTYVLRSRDLVEPSRHRIANAALERSIDGSEDRAYLMRLVEIAVDDDVEFAELWEVTWQVEGFEVPPFDLDRPRSERLLVVLRPDRADTSP